MKCSFKFTTNYQSEPSSFVNFHKHDCFELVYYIKGEGSTKIANREYVYKPCTFAIIRPNTLHDERHKEYTDLVCLGFTYEGDEINIISGMYKDNSNKTILSLLKQIKEEAAEQRPFYESKLYYLLNETLIELERLSNRNQTKSKDFKYIINYIDEHYNQPIEMEKLAEACDYSYHHFRHLFKAKTGYSPQSYIINQRIINAKRLLGKSDLSVSQVAQECGFSNESQFSSIFKRNTGKTPTSFRKIT